MMLLHDRLHIYKHVCVWLTDWKRERELAIICCYKESIFHVSPSCNIINLPEFIFKQSLSTKYEPLESDAVWLLFPNVLYTSEDIKLFIDFLSHLSQYVIVASHMTSQLYKPIFFSFLWFFFLFYFFFFFFCFAFLEFLLAMSSPSMAIDKLRETFEIWFLQFYDRRNYNIFRKYNNTVG